MTNHDLKQDRAVIAVRMAEVAVPELIVVCVRHCYIPDLVQCVNDCLQMVIE